jgi:hypothetical protein
MTRATPTAGNRGSARVTCATAATAQRLLRDELEG